VPTASAAPPTPIGPGPGAGSGTVRVPTRPAPAVGSTAPSGATAPAASLPAPVRSIAQLFDRTVPGGLKTLQWLLAILLLAYLGSSWATSLVVARRGDPSTHPPIRGV
jgi:hypothetical protein